MWGTSLGRRPARRSGIRVAAAGGRELSHRSTLGGAAACGRAARRAVEALEARVFMHAGPHLTPTGTGPFNGQQQVATAANVTVTFASDLNAATL